MPPSSERRASLVRGLEAVFVLIRSAFRNLRVVELLQLLDQTLSHFRVVQRAARQAHFVGAAGWINGQDYEHAALEGTVVLFIKHVLVALQGRRVPLLQEKLDL